MSALYSGLGSEEPPESVENYVVSRETIEGETRRPGVSALIRYYNDRFTLIPSLESIRGIFDEIVIVHQPCDDFSEDLLSRIGTGELPSLAGETIRIFCYPWFVCPPLGPVSPRRVQNSLANYCNYGLSKIQTEYFIKIDTDQIYFTSRFKEMVHSGVSEGVNFCPFGINLFFDHNEMPIFCPEELYNGLSGDTQLMSFANKPFFVQAPLWEVLTAGELNGRRFPEPLWLHVPQIRRPERLNPDFKFYNNLPDHSTFAEAYSSPAFSVCLASASAALREANKSSHLFRGIDEFLIAGCESDDSSEERSSITDSRTFIVGFYPQSRLFGNPEKGSHGEIKADLYFVESCTGCDLSLLNGKRIMFSRPLEDIESRERGFCVTNEEREIMALFTKNICHVPKIVIIKFEFDYGFDNPSSEVIFFYYICAVLRKKVKAPSIDLAARRLLIRDRGIYGDFEREMLEMKIIRSIMAGSSIVVESLDDGVAQLAFVATLDSKLPVRIDADTGSLREIVAEGIWEKLEPRAAVTLGKECFRCLEDDGVLVITTLDLGAVSSFFEGGDSDVDRIVKEYIDIHLPLVGLYVPAVMINHWFERCKYVYDEGLLVETLAEAGFLTFLRREETLGVLTIIACKSCTESRLSPTMGS